VSKKKRKYSNTVHISELVPNAMLCHEIYILTTSRQACKVVNDSKLYTNKM